MSPVKTNKKRQKCEIYSRVSGYLRPVDQWNDAKQTEFECREMYNAGGTEV